MRLRGGLRLVPAWDRSTLTAQLTGRVTSAAAGVGSSLSVESQRCEWRRCPSDSPVRLTAKASSSLEVNDHLDPTLGLESLNGTGRPWGRAGLRPGAGPGRSARGQAVPHLLRFLARPSELVTFL